MLTYLVLYCIITFIFLTIGYAVILTIEKEIKYDFFDFFFVGVCFVGAILNIWSLFLPTNVLSFLFLLILSLICLFYIKKRNRLNLADFFIRLKTYTKSQPYFIFTVLIIIIFILFSSIVTPRLFDSHLYHIGAIKWNEMYKVVPGLANFHDRFGFNSSFFVMSASFTLSSILNQSLYLLSSLITLVFFIWLIKIAFDKKGITAFICIFYLYFFYEQYNLDISSPSSDLLPNILISYLFFKLLILGENFKNQYLLLVVIPFFCITLKLSTIPVLLISFIALFYRHNKINMIKYLFVYGIIFVLPWIIRNVVLTGYILYPFEGIDIFNFDWKVPVENVKETKDWVYSWAKIPFYDSKEVLNKSFSEWFSIWWEMTDLKNRRLFSIALVSPILVTISLIFNRHKLNKVLILTYSICYLGFIFWLLKAPDFRFSFSLILLLNIFVIFVIFDQRIFLHKYTTHVITILMISTLLIITKKSFLLFTEDYKVYDVSSYLYKPVNYNTFVKKCDADFIKNKYYFENKKEIILYGPSAKNSSRCFDKIPCSAYLNNKIKLRGNSLNDGFKFEK